MENFIKPKDVKKIKEKLDSSKCDLFIKKFNLKLNGKNNTDGNGAIHLNNALDDVPTLNDNEFDYCVGLAMQQGWILSRYDDNYQTTSYKIIPRDSNKYSSNEILHEESIDNIKLGGLNLRVGFNSHRLISDEPYHKKEIEYVKAINRMITVNPQILSQIVNHGDKNNYLNKKNYLNINEERIVLSVIQWLGTHVGQSFINEVENKYNEG